VARTLLLVRHAKAVADAATDEERALAPRGVRDARAAGRWLVEHGLIPDQVIVSPAHRTVQTWETMKAELAVDPPVVTDRRIYDNTIESLLAVVNEAPDEADTLAIVGHNPSVQGFAVALDDGRGDPRARADIADAIPTAGITVLTVEGSWDELTPGGATVRAFAVARD
jgi:phosphohistidine phosphatase